MAKKAAAPEAVQEEPVEAQENNPLQEFVNHQGNALIEVGRAAASLIPAGLRKHGWNAIEESAKGFGVLIEAVVDGVGDVARTVKDEIILPDDKGKSKVEVKVEDEDK